MNELNEKLVRIIDGYDPNEKDMLCKIDIIKLSQLEALHNPSEKIKGAVERFLRYATDVVKMHPMAHLEENIKKMFGDSLEKMKEIAPEAYERYEAAQKKEKTKTMSFQNESYAIGL